jgi:hypothetical protein
MGNVGDLHGLVHEYHLFIVTVVAALTNGTVCELKKYDFVYMYNTPP